MGSKCCSSRRHYYTDTLSFYSVHKRSFQVECKYLVHVFLFYLAVPSSKPVDEEELRLLILLIVFFLHSAQLCTHTGAYDG